MGDEQLRIGEVSRRSGATRSCCARGSAATACPPRPLAERAAALRARRRRSGAHDARASRAWARGRGGGGAGAPRRAWRIVYLGTDAPLDTVEDASGRLRPSLVVLVAVSADRIRPVAGIVALGNDLPAEAARVTRLALEASSPPAA